MMLVFLLGVFAGVLLTVLVAYVYLFSPFAPFAPTIAFADQFQPLRLAPILRSFLKPAIDDSGTLKWESCLTLSLVLHFLYQEHKDTRRFRRWFHKRLQLELNDMLTRSTAGRLIQDIRVRDLSTGSQFPVLKGAMVESYRMSEDNEGFERLSMLIDVDYTGGFQASVDVSMLFGRYAQLSIKVAHLSGKARLTLTRQPFTHWTFAFVEMPLLDFKVESQWQGKQLKHIIPLITQQFRRVIQRKHVLPNYKIRYRPFFMNPLLMPSPPIGAFDHIETIGGLEVTVLQCTRLNTSLAAMDHSEVYCVLTLEQRPFLHNSTASSTHSVTVLLNFIRHGLAEPLGLTFNRSVAELGLRAVQIDSIDRGSAAEKCGFLPGDIILAVNNVPIQNERQANRLFGGTTGELSVLIERNFSESNCASSPVTVDPEDVIIQNGMYDEGYLLLGGAAEMRSALNAANGGQRSISVEIKTPVTRQRSHSTSKLISGTIEANLSNVKQNSSVNDYDHCGSLPTALLSQVGIRGDQPSANTLAVKSEMRKARSEVELVHSELSVEFHIKPTIEETLIDSPTQEDVTSSSVGFVHSDQNTYESTNVSDTISLSAFPSSMKSSSIPDVSVEGEPSSPVKHASFQEKEKPVSRRERIQARAAEVHARAAEMAAAGKARVSDLWYRRKDCSPHVELAAEVIPGELLDQSPSASPSLQRKKYGGSIRIKKMIIPHSKNGRKGSTTQEDETEKCVEGGTSTEAVHSRSTKSLALNENILWGQSLHFALDKNMSKYLNLSVHSRCPIKKDSHTDCAPPMPVVEPTKPAMLGYVSIPISQILDDCQLTLSNCHREVFTLRPPMDPITRRTTRHSVQEASRHAGFDARLCYGDILLGFRYFPDGLPDGVALNQQLNDTSEEEEEQSTPAVIGTMGIDEAQQRDAEFHRFEAVQLRSGCICAVCKGKVWLKSASRCMRCQLVCHNKCVSKLGNTLDVCLPNQHFDDSNFEILDDTTLANPDVPTFLDDTISSQRAVEELTSPSPSHSTDVDDENGTLTRRRRIANRVSEKWTSTWSRMSRRKIAPPERKPSSQESPMPPNVTSDVSPGSIATVESAIPDVFAALGISGNLSRMKYQPGNAYNEEMISAAKNVGKEIFSDMEPAERKAKINEQMDQIQWLINKTTAERLSAMEVSKLCDEESAEFVALDLRLQALAVLMLHYCAALQNCFDREEELEGLNGEERKNLAAEKREVKKADNEMEEQKPGEKDKEYEKGKRNPSEGTFDDDHHEENAQTVHSDDVLTADVSAV